MNRSPAARGLFVLVTFALLFSTGVGAAQISSDAELEQVVLQMSVVLDDMLGVEGIDPVVEREAGGIVSITFPLPERFLAGQTKAKSFELLGIGVSGITPSSLTSLITKGMIRSYSEDNLWWTWINLNPNDEVANTIAQRKCKGAKFTAKGNLTYSAGSIGFKFVEDVPETEVENITCLFQVKAAGAGKVKFKARVQDP